MEESNMKKANKKMFRAMENPAQKMAKLQQQVDLGKGKGLQGAESDNEEMEENYMQDDLDLLGFDMDNLFEGRKPAQETEEQKEERQKLEKERLEKEKKDRVQQLLNQLSEYAKDENILSLMGTQGMSEEQKLIVQNMTGAEPQVVTKKKRRASISSMMSASYSSDESPRSIRMSRDLRGTRRGRGRGGRREPRDQRMEPEILEQPSITDFIQSSDNKPVIKEIKAEAIPSPEDISPPREMEKLSDASLTYQGKNMAPQDSSDSSSNGSDHSQLNAFVPPRVPADEEEKSDYGARITKSPSPSKPQSHVTDDIQDLSDFLDKQLEQENKEKLKKGKIQQEGVDLDILSRQQEEELSRQEIERIEEEERYKSHQEEQKKLEEEERKKKREKDLQDFYAGVGGHRFKRIEGRVSTKKEPTQEDSKKKKSELRETKKEESKEENIIEEDIESPHSRRASDGAGSEKGEFKPDFYTGEDEFTNKKNDLDIIQSDEGVAQPGIITVEDFEDGYEDGKDETAEVDEAGFMPQNDKEGIEKKRGRARQLRAEFDDSPEISSGSSEVEEEKSAGLIPPSSQIQSHKLSPATSHLSSNLTKKSAPPKSDKKSAMRKPSPGMAKKSRLQRPVETFKSQRSGLKGATKSGSTRPAPPATTRPAPSASVRAAPSAGVKPFQAPVHKITTISSLCDHLGYTVISQDSSLIKLKQKVFPCEILEITKGIFQGQTGNKEVQVELGEEVVKESQKKDDKEVDRGITQLPIQISPPLEDSSKDQSSKKFDFGGLEMDGMDDMLMDDLDMEDMDDLEGDDPNGEVAHLGSDEIQVESLEKLKIENAHSQNPAESSKEGNQYIFLMEDQNDVEINLKKTQSYLIKKESLKLSSQESIDQLGAKGSNEMILKLIKERESYRERLRLAKRAIEVRDSHIQKMKSEGNIVPLDMTNSRLHLAFMFSSPLIREINSKTENIMQLDYLTEIQDIVKVCNKMKYEMKYKEEVATVSNMRSVITDGPIALHFSGHGIENTPENIGSDYFMNKDKGNILLLEDEQGMSYYLYEKDLIKMIKEANTNFEVVFVSSCHSQFAGQVFLNAGAKHVICIQQGEKISDKASLRFSKVFYETLFVKHYNVCTSFRIAKEEIDKVINPTEANKFLLLTQDDEKIKSSKAQEGLYGFSKKTNSGHDCNALTNFKEGCLTNMNLSPLFSSNPSSVEGFIGRQKEMYEIIKHLGEHRLVSILGPPGIGKTSLARNLANYIKDRRKFSDGIIYVALRG